MNSRTLAYLKDRGMADREMAVLRAFARELSERMPVEQLRSLAYLAGKRFAGDHGVGSAKTVSDFESFANQLFLELDWGWISVSEAAEGVDLRHGCAPLQRWFGDTGRSWGGGFFEGVYAEWMRQLGAGPHLDVKEMLPVGSSGDETGHESGRDSRHDSGSDSGGVLHFRLAHESSFV